jgi:ribulose-phosphate 3-epimerase
LHRQLTRIRELGCAAGVALNPATPVEMVQEVIPELDLLLIMTVNPGFGGQEFIPHLVPKVARARALLDVALSGAALEVDGGVSRKTISVLHDAGADTFVAGHSIFSAREPQKEIAALRAACGTKV